MGASEKIRVLIVDDTAETRENVRKLLQFESDFEVVGVARTGQEAIEVAQESKPDVVLMDINMPDMDGITATEIIRKNHPFAQIVILSIQGDPNYMRRAMLAGARDFLTKPPSVDELISAVRRAGKLAQEESAKNLAALPGKDGKGLPSQAMLPGGMKGKIITLHSPKGGTGCTTVAVNLALALHTDETPVVLVDGNMQYGDVAVFLNLQAKNTILDLASRADELDTEIIDEVLIAHPASGVKVLAAPSRPEYAEDVSGEQLAKILEYLRYLYAYIIVDTASALIDPTLSVIDSCDALVLLVTQEIPSIKNARLFLDLAEMLKLHRDQVILVMNRFDKRVAISPAKIGENFKHAIAEIIPFEDRIVLQSINRGTPLMLEDKSRPIAKSFINLSETIRQSMEAIETREELEEPVRLGRR